MGKPAKWLKRFLTGKKDKEKVAATGIIGQNVGPVTADNPAAPVVYPPMTPREKKRWSFRRTSAASTVPAASQSGASISEDDQKKHAMAVAVAATAMMLTATANVRSSSVEGAAAVKIQSAFRSYLARKALRALRGLVKLQALVRGHLVRKQAKATLRCMQALVTAQARARAQRLHVTDDIVKPSAVRPSTHHRGPSRVTGREILDWGCNDFVALMQEIDIGMTEENIKIVEMALGESRPSAKTRNRYLYPTHLQPEGTDHRFSTPCPVSRAYPYQDNYHQMSPARSAFTEMSPRMGRGHFEDFPFRTAWSSPQCYSAVSKPNPSRIPFSVPRPEYAESLSYDYSFYPNYMANTESSRAKSRSQSAPKQRPPNYFERQTSRRRLSMEGRGVPRGTARMQRSSSHVGSAVQGYQYPPWSGMQLDRSTVSLKGSESGSTTSTVMTNTNYCEGLIEAGDSDRSYK